MSGAPFGWQTPKTNWQAADVVVPADLNRAEGNSLAIETGERTLDQNLAGRANTGTIRQFLSWFAGLFRAITGKTNWYDAPDTTLAAAKAHIDATSAHSATSTATPDRMVLRDASGRSQFADPAAAADAMTRRQAVYWALIL